MQHPGWGGELPFDRWGTSWINAVGRRAEGVSFEEARTSMDVVTARLRGAPPGDPGVHEDIRILLADGVGLSPDERAEARRISTLLLGIVGLVLLLTCTNVANLFLARAAARRSEVGVRRALGAGRARLARQLVTESLLLALLATGLAVPLVLASGRLLPVVFPYTVSVSLAPDSTVFGLLAGVGLVAGLIFGAAPAWVSSRADVTAALRLERPTEGRGGTRLRDGLVVAQLALSLALVTGAALLGRSVLNARSAEPGFEPEGLVVAFTDLQPTGRYDATSGLDLFARLLEAAERIPGVTTATLANQAPIAGGHARATVRPAGREDVSFEAEYVLVGPRYFETLGIPVVRGRALGGFSDEAEPVVVVNRTLAEMFWPGQDPVGRELDRPDGNLRVVGVAGDAQMRSLRSRPNPAVYYPISRFYSSGVALHLRTEGSTAEVATRLREAVADVDPELPLMGVQDLRTVLVRSMGETRSIGLMVAAFAGLA
ncbi:MAG TPA: ABC transporter permease, partial [Longimicrobiales bacterium]|nr:ABC transporter permease [Longimicrobiales bacterium]